MVNKILGTTATRILNALYNLIILWLLTNYVGSEGFGVISLVLVAITIVQVFIDLLGGGALIYFTSRLNQTALLFISYFWIFIVLLVIIAIFLFLNIIAPNAYSTLIPQGQETNILLLAFLNALMLTHYNLLIGQGNIKQYNIVFTIQISTLLLGFVYYIFILNNISHFAYIQSLKISYLTGAVLSFIVLIKYLKYIPVKDIYSIVQQIFKFGFISQLANGFHILNKRISFYFVSSMTGLSSLGIYNAGIQLTEGLRLIGQSVSLVQFSEISNSNSKDFAKDITIKLMKLSVILTILGVSILLLIPENLYQIIFTKEFVNLKTIIIALSPGVVALAANTIFSHYFSGLGNPKVSLWANIIGFIATIVFALILIPIMGYVGAAITTSISYISTVIYQYFIFKSYTATKAADWMLKRKDLNDLSLIFKQLFNSKKS